VSVYSVKALFYLCVYKKMDGIFRALGFDSKPVYAERIPESLKASDFNVHEVSSALYTGEGRYCLLWKHMKGDSEL